MGGGGLTPSLPRRVKLWSVTVDTASGLRRFVDLVAESVGGRLVFVSWWSYSSRPFPSRSISSSGGMHRGCPSSIIRVLGGLFHWSLVLHLLFLVVLVVVLVCVSTLFYLNIKRVMHDLKKYIC
jgi:hypothetical protein